MWVVATIGVVLSTLREAFDTDYGLPMLGYLRMDRDEEVHRVCFDAESVVV